MELIKYLNEHFITKSELLECSKITEQELKQFQHEDLVPKASYKLELNLASNSFFGLHSENQELEYYGKGYISWLATVKSLESNEAVYLNFVERYKAAINSLKGKGYASADHKVNEGMDLHIEEEWSHFLNGIYGLCTKSGLPEDIAAKDFAILIINEIIEAPTLDEKQRKRLESAVNLLDSVSALFAPHERLKSSRHRLVDEIRRKYQLKPKEVNSKLV